VSRLNYHHLAYFWTVARTGNLTRAAEQLHVSQSALSVQIRQLESQLGQQLFAREGRRLVLTDAGTLALNYAETIFGAGRELMAVMQEGQAAGRRSLRIGGVATLSRNFQENFLKPLLVQDDVELTIASGSLEELLERLRVHQLDVVLSNRPAQGDARQPWRTRRVARQPVSLIGEPRRSRRAFRFPDDLRGRSVLLPGPNSEIRAGFDVLCEQLELSVRVMAEVDDMAMLRLLARDAHAIALLPPVVVQDEIASGRLEEYCQLPQIYENFYAITMPKRFQPPLLRELLARPESEVLRAQRD
jgi:LysR family transcriptional activator of nhaA